MLRSQRVTLLPISLLAHLTPARPTQLRVALSLDCVAVSLTFTPFLFLIVNLNLFLNCFSTIMFSVDERSETTSFIFTVD